MRGHHRPACRRWSSPRRVGRRRILSTERDSVSRMATGSRKAGAADPDKDQCRHALAVHTFWPITPHRHHGGGRFVVPEDFRNLRLSTSSPSADAPSTRAGIRATRTGGRNCRGTTSEVLVPTIRPQLPTYTPWYVVVHGGANGENSTIRALPCAPTPAQVPLIGQVASSSGT